MNMPKIPSITTQSIVNAVVYAVIVGGVFYAAKKGASMLPGTAATTVVKTAADIAGVN